MATRTVKRIECDDKGCRRRTGVKEYTYHVVDTANQVTVAEITAEHCPYHLALNIRRLKNSATNTKEYPADQEDN